MEKAACIVWIALGLCYLPLVPLMPLPRGAGGVPRGGVGVDAGAASDAVHLHGGAHDGGDVAGPGSEGYLIVMAVGL
jgi:hypothetical protein